MAEGVRGRSSTYTQEAAEEICQRISTGETLRQICRDEEMPAWRTVYDWLAASKDFAARFAQARVAGFDAIAEECLEIADDARHDTRTAGSGDNTYEVANTEWIGRSKVRIETRLKLLAKWDPKRYGERVELAGSLTVNKAAADMTDDELAALATRNAPKP